MDSTQIINENIVFECKQYIAKTLAVAATPNYLTYGIDTNKLIEIYNNINSSNAQELYTLSKDLVSTHTLNSRLKVSGGMIIGGAVILGAGYTLSSFYQESKFCENVTSVGGLIVFMGLTLALLSSGH